MEGGRIPESALSAPIEDTLAKWKLTVHGVPTNGAAMLFSNNIYPYDNFQLRLARFLGKSKLEFIDNQRAEGNFFDLLDAGMAFFFKHLNLSGKITDKSLMREERLEVPVRALREALINALCHRQWEKQNLTISIAVYDDRVEIANPGVFPPQIPIENIKESHESYPYNRNMAQALYRSTFLESWGSGIHRIIEACREQSVEDPTWRWDGGFVYVTFKRPVKLGSHSAQVPTKQEDEPLNHRPNTDQVPPKFATSLPQDDLIIRKQGDESTQGTTSKGESTQESIHEQDRSIRESIQENPTSLKSIQESIQKLKSNRDRVILILSIKPSINLDEVARIIGLSRIGVQKIVGKLKAEGILSRDGSTKAGKWIVNKEHNL